MRVVGGVPLVPLDLVQKGSEQLMFEVAQTTTHQGSLTYPITYPKLWENENNLRTCLG